MLFYFVEHINKSKLKYFKISKTHLILTQHEPIYCMHQRFIMSEKITGPKHSIQAVTVLFNVSLSVVFIDIEPIHILIIAISALTVIAHNHVFLQLHQ